jgi:hypothetical protein
MDGMKRLTTLSAGMLVLAAFSLGSAAQAPAPGDRPTDSARPDGEGATAPAKKLQNPIGDLYSFPFQNNTNFNTSTTVRTRARRTS